MIRLLSRIFAIFAFRSKRSLVILLGVFVVSVSIVPASVDMLAKFILRGTRLNQITKINAIDKSKLKEPLLRESYNNLVQEFAKEPNLISIRTVKSPARLVDYFNKDNIGRFIFGSLLWVLLGIVSLFAMGEKVLAKIAVFLLLALIGFLAGILVENIPIIAPPAIFLAFILSVELLLMGIFGTLIREVNSKA
jgi:hypothetical protein